jgi:lysophospholipase L1-like esterase
VLFRSESKDNAFPAVYSIHRKGEGGKWVKVAESIPTRYADRVGDAGKYTYRITAADYDNNVSEPSKDVTVAVKSVPTIEFPPPTVQQTDRAGYAANVRKIHAAGAGKVRQDVFLFAGDSITAADAYTHVLGQWLARGITVRQGVGQMQTGYGKSQIDGYLAAAKPEFAVVMYGTNDSKSPDAVKAGMDNLAYVIDACAKYGTVPIMATIPPRGFNKDQQAGEKAFSEALIKLCREKQVPVSYCFDLMIQRDLKQMLSDGVHLVPGTGNDAAGEALLLTLEQVYFALRDKSDSW